MKPADDEREREPAGKVSRGKDATR